MVLSIITIVVIKGSVTVDVRNNTVILAASIIILSVVTGVIGGLTIQKTFKANQLYLQVASEAAEGKLPISKHKSPTTPVRHIFEKSRPTVLDPVFSTPSATAPAAVAATSTNNIDLFM